jgi:hypothetical protein
MMLMDGGPVAMRDSGMHACSERTALSSLLHSTVHKNVAGTIY